MTIRGSPRWRAGAALTVAVLVVHGLLLQAMHTPATVGPASRARSVTVRTIERPAPTTSDRAPVPASAAPVSNLPRTSATHTQAAVTPRAAEPARPAPATAAAEPDTASLSAPEPRATLPTSTARAFDAAATSAQPSADVVLPASRTLRYEVTAQTRGVTLQGESRLQWQHAADRYEARLEMRLGALPPRVQHSSGRLSAGGLEPSRFSDKGRSEHASHFERDKGQVIFSSNRPAAPLEPGAQDRLSVLLQLASRIAAAPQLYPPSTAIAIQTVGARDAAFWTFRVEGPEALQLPGGTVSTLKLQRRPQLEYDTTVDVWLAPSMDYVPVRMRLTQANGDWVEHQWSATDR